MPLSPNQFALPGMEEQAHPLAKYLPRGFNFEESEEHRPKLDTGNYHRVHNYVLEAHHPEAGRAAGWASEGPRTLVSHLTWAGEHDESHAYPGEIAYVKRERRPEGSSGITDALHGFASMGGRGTVPVHSMARRPLTPAELEEAAPFIRLVLERMLDLLDSEEAWVKGALERDGKLCILGAMQRAQGELGLRANNSNARGLDEARQRVCLAVQGFFEDAAHKDWGQGVAGFNDRVDTTFEDVRLWLKGCLDKIP